jgi:hypothetical protein
MGKYREDFLMVLLSDEWSDVVKVVSERIEAIMFDVDDLLHRVNSKII